MPYRLGLPAWGFPGWAGRYFTNRPSRLASYARVFNCVEGNTTFYAVPDDAQVARWREAVAGTDLRICFKLPRTVTHEPRPSLEDCEAFFAAVEPLGRQLGPLLLQFPASFGPAQLNTLVDLLERVPQAMPRVIEVRHPAFFSDPQLLRPILDAYAAGRVTLDARPIHHADTTHPEVASARHEKPDLPVLDGAVNGRVFVRLVLHPDEAISAPYIERWASRIAAHIAAGVDCWFMVHCPNNLHCPAYAASFHDALRSRIATLAPLPDWPVPQQRTLL